MTAFNNLYCTCTIYANCKLIYTVRKTIYADRKSLQKQDVVRYDYGEIIERFGGVPQRDPLPGPGKPPPPNLRRAVLLPGARRPPILGPRQPPAPRDIRLADMNPALPLDKIQVQHFRFRDLIINWNRHVEDQWVACVRIGLYRHKSRNITCMLFSI